MTNRFDLIWKYSLITLAALSWFFASPLTAFFTSVFFVWWAFKLDPRILLTVALMLVLGMAAFFSVKLDVQAHNLAVYVYTLLMLSSALFVLEIISDRYRGL